MELKFTIIDASCTSPVVGWCFAPRPYRAESAAGTRHRHRNWYDPHTTLVFCINSQRYLGNSICRVSFAIVRLWWMAGKLNTERRLEANSPARQFWAQTSVSYNQAGQFRDLLSRTYLSTTAGLGLIWSIRLPPNLQIEIDDAEAEWAYSPDTFDFIHARTLGGSIADWDKLLRQAYDHLKPGGWIELQELEVWLKTDNESFLENSSILEWLHLVEDASTTSGRRMNVAEMHKGALISAGFEDVCDDVYKVRSVTQTGTTRAKTPHRYQYPHGRKIPS